MMDCLFLNIEITFAMLSLSGNIPVFTTWFINSVSDFIIAGSIIFNSLDEMPSKPQLFFVGRFSMVFFTASSSTFVNVN